MTTPYQYEVSDVFPAAVSVLSEQYVNVTVTALTTSGPTDPTSGTVSFAFLPAGNEPGTADWVSGIWQSGSLNGQYLAGCLIGPGGGTALTEGAYGAWWQIASGSVTTVAAAGQLTITA